LTPTAPQAYPTANRMADRPTAHTTANESAKPQAQRFRGHAQAPRASPGSARRPVRYSPTPRSASPAKLPSPLKAQGWGTPFQHGPIYRPAPPGSPQTPFPVTAQPEQPAKAAAAEQPTPQSCITANSRPTDLDQQADRQAGRRAPRETPRPAGKNARGCNARRLPQIAKRSQD